MMGLFLLLHINFSLLEKFCWVGLVEHSTTELNLLKPYFMGFVLKIFVKIEKVTTIITT